jgi:hypothetical protein
MLNELAHNGDFLGLPLGSDNPRFVIIVAVHILLSLSAVLSGLTAMLKEKNSGEHAKYGKLYCQSILSAFITVVILAVMRWPHNNHLLLIGTLTLIFTVTGRRLVQNKESKWARYHTICMGSSYILLLTGFYVDNGEHLPFWNRFPQWFFWIFPTLIGLPIIAYILRKHPLTRQPGHH